MFSLRAFLGRPKMDIFDRQLQKREKDVSQLVPFLAYFAAGHVKSNVSRWTFWSPKSNTTDGQAWAICETCCGKTAIHSSPSHVNATVSAQRSTFLKYTLQKKLKTGLCETFWRLSPKKTHGLSKKQTGSETDGSRWTALRNALFRERGLPVAVAHAEPSSTQKVSRGSECKRGAGQCTVKVAVHGLANGVATDGVLIWTRFGAECFGVGTWCSSQGRTRLHNSPS